MKCFFVKCFNLFWEWRCIKHQDSLRKFCILLLSREDTEVIFVKGRYLGGNEDLQVALKPWRVGQGGHLSFA